MIERALDLYKRDEGISNADLIGLCSTTGDPSLLACSLNPALFVLKQDGDSVRSAVGVAATLTRNGPVDERTRFGAIVNHHRQFATEGATGGG